MKLRYASTHPSRTAREAASESLGVTPRWVGVGSALGAGVLLLAATESVLNPVEAAGVPVTELSATTVEVDYDGDGLSDDQERVLGTFPFFDDSDDDGFTDGEEVARQSDPLDFFSVPLIDEVSANLTARGKESAALLVLVIYEPAGALGQSFVRLGALRGGQVVSVPLARFSSLMTYTSQTTSSGGQLICAELPIPPNFIEAAGEVTFFVAAGDTVSQSYSAAAKVDVSSVGGVPLMRRTSVAQSSLQASQGGGSVRQPIPGSASPSIPSNWVPGSICFQRSAVVGGNGPIMLHQVIEADCLQGWDTFCVSDCSTALGSTYETIDPIALIGG